MIEFIISTIIAALLMFIGGCFMFVLLRGARITEEEEKIYNKIKENRK